jgi:hypothetical protein
MADHEWQIGDEVEYIYSSGKPSGHFGIIFELKPKESSYKQFVSVRDYTCNSCGLDRYEGDQHYVLWYAEGLPTEEERIESGWLSLRKPSPQAETRIGLCRESIDWTAHEELKRLALGNQK